MRMTKVTRTHTWAVMFAGFTIVTTVLIVMVNPLEAAIVHLALLFGTIVLGLLTGPWGGVVAAAAGVVAITFSNQYASIYARENAIANLATELAAFLMVGLLAGGLGRSIDRVRREAKRWLERAEELTVHNETFGTLKPAWARTRLDEEVTRAQRFQRPLSIALLQLQANPDVSTGPYAHRIAALQAVIRMARAATQPPTLITHAGGDQVLMILPEQDSTQAQLVVSALQRRFEQEVYFPPTGDQALGKPIREWGQLCVSLVSLNGVFETGETLLAKAHAAQESE